MGSREIMVRRAQSSLEYRRLPWPVLGPVLNLLPSDVEVAHLELGISLDPLATYVIFRNPDELPFHIAQTRDEGRSLF